MKGSTIAYARKTLGLTQAELARLLNKTQLSVTHWETDSSKPSADNERRIKRVLGLDDKIIVKIETLLRDEQHKQIKEHIRKHAEAAAHNEQHVR